MNIREFNENDRELYFEMADKFYSTDAVLHAGNREIMSRIFDDIMAKSIFIRGVFIQENGKDVGFALIASSYSTEYGCRLILLEELYISDEMRGKGIGSQFLKWLVAEYDNEKFGFRLEVSPKNSKVLNLYKKFGFEELDYIQMIRA